MIVQHLDPNYEGAMCELLQRITPMPVQQIKDNTEIKANNVYLIPPAFDLFIQHGVLHLSTPTEPHGQGHPIDTFFQSLAVDKKEHGIGVILSGMGSDGTLGLQAIKAGLADVVEPAENLIHKIISFVSNLPLLDVPATQTESEINQLEKVFVLLRARTGHDFSSYKKSTISRRIERRMALHHLNQISDYVVYIRANPSEAELLFKELLIGVTSFFRDPKIWDQLKTEIIPDLFSKYPDGGELRAWVPACSTGEEAYTLAMVFKEALENSVTGNHFSLQIFATDLDNEAIDKARAGIYSSSIKKEVPAKLLKRFFIPEDGKYRVSKEIREMVIFAPQNILMDPPFTKLDILTCRNLLIYLETDLQKKLLPLFHYSLNPGGILVLGSSETVGSAHDLFDNSHRKTHIYFKVENHHGSEQVEFPSVKIDRHINKAKNSKVNKQAASTNLLDIMNANLLQEFTPSAVISSEKGDILFIHGKTGNYLEPAAGKVNNNLFAMAREGLIAPLTEGFNRAVRTADKVIQKNIHIGANLVDIFIKPLTEPTPMKGMVLVAFIDAPLPLPVFETPRDVKLSTKQNTQLDILTAELITSKQALQNCREEMQASQEELKSTNEELQSTNEELQSTNEELTTSKEEMQSMNEELQTVNHELSAKVDELSKSQ